jgi:dihydroxyacetone kinase
MAIGGSGHEPAHAGYVGEGMLDVAVTGNIFASPSSAQVFKAIRAFSSEEGFVIPVLTTTLCIELT